MTPITALIRTLLLNIDLSTLMVYIILPSLKTIQAYAAANHKISFYFMIVVISCSTDSI